MQHNIRNKLIVLAGLPLLVVAIILSTLVLERYNTVREINALMPLNQLNIHIGDLMHEIQKERGISVKNISKKNNALQKQRGLTDSKIKDIKNYIATLNLDAHRSEFRKSLIIVQYKMESIKKFRTRVDNNDVTIDEIIDFYSKHNELWSTIINISSEIIVNPKIRALTSAYRNFLQGKDAVGTERALMSYTFSIDYFEAGKYGYFQNLLAEQNHYFSQFKELATKEQNNLFDQIMLRPEVRKTQLMRNIALSKGEPNKKPSLISALHESFGYGGLIHHFKNLLLRGDVKYEISFEKDLKKINNTLDKLVSLKQTTEEEKQYIETIRHTANLYAAHIKKIRAMINDGQKITDIDNVVAINDNHALKAIHELSKAATFGKFNVDSEYWFSTMTKQIDLLKLVENKIADDLGHRGEMLKHEAQEGLIFLIIFAIIFISIVMSITICMARSLTQPLAKVINFAGEIANNNFDNKLNIDKKGEIGDLGDALNKMSDNIQKTIYNLADSEKKIKKAMNEAQSATIAKSEFLANMSHEIRTPLNGILGTISLLDNTDPKQQEKINIINSCGEGLLEIINEILDFSKIEAGEMVLELSPGNLKNIVQDTAALLATKANDKGLELKYMYADNVPIYLLCDIGRIRQIIINLVGNAIKFTDEGSVIIKVTATIQPPDKATLLFEIIDTGIGLTKENQDLVFNKFTQTDSSSIRKTSGTGLGLSICQSLVEMMGGKIGINSTLGKGSTFWFSLPLIIAKAEDIHTENNHIGNIEFDADVLLVDDTAANLFVTTNILESMGCRIDTAKDGIEAIEIIEKNDYDIILMDCQMPRMDGYTATQKIRSGEEKGQHRTIIAFTANAMAYDKQKCLDAGMDDYLIKPIKKHNLANMLKKWDIPYTEATEDSSPSPQDLNLDATSDSDNDNLNCIEIATFEGMRDMMKDNFELFIEKSFEDISRLIKEIDQAIKEKDCEEIAACTHPLKSVTAQIGFIKISEISKQMEMISKEDKFDGIEELYKKILKEYDLLLIEVKNIG